MNCVFCKIASKELNSDIVYEDDTVVAFNDVSPKAPHHILIIPRKHIATLNDASSDDTELLGYIIQTSKKLAKKLGIAKRGYRVLINCNEEGGQEVYHLHLHLLGGRAMTWPPG